ncbi:signal peptidase II [Candidatus Kinetoplastibacterium oncopeltii TCC290E]|uniref:Lipoprotein signal peptidase n=1 Tax=Candidatus Kinetoplastidibacterium stringomonadis TCC290E TaxID=1208920 RepID=M1LRT9_9PROT|nr:signal peptidase II [Candidatus Kinetoplastibacterium oncopeltii]AGF48237.1 signal peptidase II [Candidatus Kinetoplastibacterium oncopeltii TCC290E]
MIHNRFITNILNLNNTLYFISILSLVFLDRVTKIYYKNLLYSGSNLKVFSFLDFTLVYNYGAAFGMLSDQQSWQRYLLIFIGIIASIFMLIFLYKLDADKNTSNIRIKFATILILSGTLGNISDRIYHGYVIDFISMHYNDFYFPVFNIADIMISVGFLFFITNEFMLKSLNNYKNQ